jgi:hypothetical protein
MASKKYYEAALKRFNAKYQVNFAIDAMSEMAQAISSLDEANLDGVSSQENEQTTMMGYANLLSDVLTVYLDKNMRIKEAGSYGLPDFSLGEFIVDFEELMEEKYRAGLKVGQKPDRKPYEGAKLSDVFNFASGVVKGYGNSIPSVWAQGVIKGAMTVDGIRAVTDREFEKLMGLGGKLEQKVKGELDAETMNRLANVVAARDAMEKVRKSRGFFWWLGNIWVNRKERKFFNQLKKACEDLKKNHFPVDSVASQLRAGAFISTDSYDAVNLEKQTKPWRYEVAERFKKMANMAGYTQMLSFKLSDKLPNGKDLAIDKINELVEGAHEVNRYYDEDIKSGIKPKQAICSSMKIIFKQAYQVTASLQYDDMSDRLLATQILTDFMLKELTAAGLKGNPFSEYANGYALKNPDEMITEIETDIAQEGFDKDSVLAAFGDAAMEWGPDENKFNLFITGFDEGVVGAQSPMVQPQVKNVPTNVANI